MIRLCAILTAVTISCFTLQGHGQGMNLTLNPNQDKVIANNTPWTINATCKIHADSTKKTIRVDGIKNTSLVNGRSLTAGHSTSLIINDRKTITVSAEAGAEVTITNLSNGTIEAVCST